MLEYIPKNFYQADFIPKTVKAFKELEADLDKNKAKFKKMFIQNFKEVCDIINENYSKMEVGFIMYNSLVSKFLNGDYSYCIYIYDKDWYMNGDIKVYDFNVRFVFDYFEKLWEEIIKDSKKYVGKINHTDVQNLMIKFIPKFNRYVAIIMREAICEATELVQYKDLRKADTFNLQVGEFYESCDIIHMEHKNKNEEKIKEWLKQKKESEYCFEDFSKIDFQSFDFQQIDLRFCDFRRSILNKADFSYSVLSGAKFKDTTLVGSNLSFCFINGTDFRNADLTGSNFESTMCCAGINDKYYELVLGLKNAVFDGAILRNVSFKNANFENINFTKAIIDGTSFSNAKLYKCVFTEEQAKNLELSAQQRHDIIVK